MLKKRLVCVCLFALVLVSTAGAEIKATIDPSDIGLGARPTGMGKAFTAVTGDVNDIFMNPAGLNSIHSFEATSMYTNLLGDINYTLLGITYPTESGTFGLGYVGVQTGDVIVTGLDVSGRPIDQGGRIGYSNNLVILSYVSYGNELEKLANLWKPINDMSLGLNVKLFSESFRGTEAQSAIGTDMDLGFTYKPRPYLTFGILGKNIMPYNSPFGGSIVWSNGTKESIPSQFRLGVAMKFFGEGAPKQWRDQDILGSADVELNPNRDYPSLLHMGLEWLPVKFLTLRAGLDQSYGGASATPATNNLTAGIGLRVKYLLFDYAYRKDNVLNDNSSHYISVSFKFKDFKSSPAATKDAEPIKTPSKAVTDLFIQDVPSNYWAKYAIDYVINSRILSLYPDGKFRPTKPITRADLAVMIVKARFSGFPPADTKELLFKDVPSKYWAKRMIGVASSQDLMRGYPDNTFKPSSKVSLLDATYAFTKLGNLAAAIVTDDVYRNIPADHFAAGMIKSAKDKGLLDFVSGPGFAVNVPVTRAQAAWMVYKLNN